MSSLVDYHLIQNFPFHLNLQSIIDFEKCEEKMMKQKSNEEAERKMLKEPHSIIIHRGKVGQFIRSLEQDMRAIMEPFTASKLRVGLFPPKLLNRISVILQI